MKRLYAGLVFVFVSAITVNASADDNWVEIVNSTPDFWITYVYISPAGSTSWGSDQLNQFDFGFIPPGASKRWNISWNGCRVDLKVVSFTGISTQRMNVDVCGGFVWTLTSGK